MKKILNCLLAAAALFAAASCAKETTPQANDDLTGQRVLVATFAGDNATKTSLEGKVPRWMKDDEIILTDGTDDSDVAHCRKFTLKNETGDISNTALIQGSGSSFKVVVPDTFGSDVYAVYPADAYGGITTEGKIKFEIPATQSGTFAESNICAAKADGDILSFKNVTAVFRFKSIIGDDAKTLEILSAGNIAGIYSFDPVAKTVAAVESNVKKIVVTPSVFEDFYVAIAPGNLAAGTNFILKDSKSNIVGTKGSGAEKVLERNKVYSLGTLTVGMLPGAFSKNNEGKKVFFSKGNLTAHIDATGKAEEFKFAQNQYDYLGSGGANCAIGSTAGNVDYFGWSTKNTEFGISSSGNDDDYSGEFYDWGVGYFLYNKSFLLSDKTWRTLDNFEWIYIISTRAASTLGSTENSRFVKIKVDSIYGLLLFPDYFAWDTAMGDLPPYINMGNVPWTNVGVYTKEQFAAIEAAGGVFLPAAGYRTGSAIQQDTQAGYYWLNGIMDATHSFRINFSGGSVESMDYQGLHYGMSVRLVTDAQ